MNQPHRLGKILSGLLLLLALVPALAADYPPPQEHEWRIPNFTFKSGETLPELRLHYTTLGEPQNEVVLILHGTTGSARSMLKDGFADELYGAGQPLDASKYYLILPDAIGTGKSSKPSDGLRMKFPAYDYDDMVEAQYRLITEHLGIRHLRLILGNSMGGMHAWLWATDHPEMMDIAVPMAAYPSEMAGRNWMMRRLLVDAIKSDPSWQNGDYREQPQNFRRTYLFFTTATNGGDQALYKTGMTREKADAYLQERLAARAGDDADLSRRGRDGALARGIETTFGGEHVAAAFEFGFERADACRFNLVEDELVVAARLIEGGAAMHAHREAVGQFARGQAEAVAVALEQRAGDLCRIILEGEVKMAGGGAAQIADFAFDPDIAVITFKLGADAGV